MLSAACEELSRVRAELAALNKQRDNLVLRAPAAGMVALRHVEPGSTLLAGQAVVEIIDPTTLWINVRFDQLRAQPLSAGLPASIPLRSQTGATLSGRVQQVRVGQPLDFERPLFWHDRIEYGRQAVRDIVGKVWIYVVIGIGVGAFIHGYVPEDFMASIMGKETWWSVPAAVAVGIPMYSNAAGIVPVVEALLGKGAALGTVLAFMMSVIALSLPEMIILRKVLKPKLIAVFILVVGAGIILTGYIFNTVI